MENKGFYLWAFGTFNFVPVPIPPSGTADRIPRGGGIPSGAWYRYFTGVYRGVTHPCIVLVKFSGSTYKAHWRKKVNSMSDVTVEGPFKNRIESSISPIFPWTEENEQCTHEREIIVKIIDGHDYGSVMGQRGRLAWNSVDSASSLTLRSS